MKQTNARRSPRQGSPLPPGILKIKHHNPLIVIGEVHWAYHTLHRKWRGVFNNYNFGFSKATVLDGTVDETHDLECTGCFSFLFFLSFFLFFFTFMSETVENEFCRRLVQLFFLFFFFFTFSWNMYESRKKKSKSAGQWIIPPPVLTGIFKVC